jgi:hypothetical protein
MSDRSWARMFRGPMFMIHDDLNDIGLDGTLPSAARWPEPYVGQDLNSPVQLGFELGDPFE